MPAHRLLSPDERSDLADLLTVRGLPLAPGVEVQMSDRSWRRIVSVRAPHVGHVEVYVETEPTDPPPPHK